MSNYESHTVAPSADNKFSVAYRKPHDYMSAVPKTRPPMSDDQLAKLAVAREKALAVRRAQKVEKLKAEAVRLEAPLEDAQSSVEPVTVEDPPHTRHLQLSQRLLHHNLKKLTLHQNQGAKRKHLNRPIRWW